MNTRIYRFNIGFAKIFQPIRLQGLSHIDVFNAIDEAIVTNFDELSPENRDILEKIENLISLIPSSNDFRFSYNNSTGCLDEYILNGQRISILPEGKNKAYAPDI
jgi:hypothetical protein